ncbi:hypothetical protein [Flavobacterium sp.]|uniref:hypothetical protein n=1 Tax=Flavobacterium sp. TaxID=239 RepID=UPI003753205A
MKQKLKKHSKLLILFLFIAFCSCQKDFDEDINPQYQNKYVIKDYSFKQANRIPKFNKANREVTAKFEAFRSQNSSTSREIDTNFSIDSTTIREISAEGYTSYTMLVVREEPTVGYFENLVIEIDSLNQTKETLITYTPTLPIEYIEEDNAYAFTGTSGKAALQTCIVCPGGDNGPNDNPDDGSDNGPSLQCDWALMCTGTLTGGTGPKHIAGPNCQQTFFEYTCSGIGGGGGGGGTPYHYGGGGGGSTPPPPTPTAGTTIVVPPLPDPCLSLSRLADPTKGNVNTAITNLRREIPNNPDGEDGVSFQISANGLGYSNVNLPTSQDNSITIPRGLRIYGAAHTHNNELEQIFSFNDLAILYNLYNECDYELQPDVFFMLVNEDGSVFAIKVNNFKALQIFLVNYMNKPKYSDISDQYDKTKIINKDFNNEIKLKGNSLTDIIRGFLELTKTAGILVIEKKDSGWEKLSLPASKMETIVKTPCN